MPLPADVAVPDSSLARAITEFVRDTETALLFNHSSRVYQFGALAGLHRGLTFDRELLYAGAMFHDLGLMPDHSSAEERFEVDGADAARDFLTAHGVPEADVDIVWTAIALHTTPGIPVHMHPVVALVTAGVEMDVLGLTYGRVFRRRARGGRLRLPPHAGLQGRHHPGLLRRRPAQAGHHLRQRQGRRHRRQGAGLPPGELLQRDPSLALGRRRA